MKEYKIKTYDEAVHIIEEIGILPLAPLNIRLSFT